MMDGDKVVWVTGLVIATGDDASMFIGMGDSMDASEGYAVVTAIDALDGHRGISKPMGMQSWFTALKPLNFRSSVTVI